MEDKDTKTFSMDEVSKHNTSDNCWLVIHNKVYDVTSFISEHPGGEIILRGCGKDATELFESKGNPGKGITGAHSQYAEELHKKYYIGELETLKL